MPIPLRVMLVDDAPDTRANLRAFLEEYATVPLEIVGEAGDGLDALENARVVRPDVVVMDVRMPRMDGPSATVKLRHEMPGTRVVLVSLYEDDPDLARRIRGAEPYAFISKDALDELLGVLADIAGAWP